MGTTAPASSPSGPGVPVPEMSSKGSAQSSPVYVTVPSHGAPTPWNAPPWNSQSAWVRPSTHVPSGRQQAPTPAHSTAPVQGMPSSSRNSSNWPVPPPNPWTSTRYSAPACEHHVTVLSRLLAPAVQSSSFPSTHVGMSQLTQ